MSDNISACGGLKRIKPMKPLDYKEQAKRLVEKEQKKKKKDKGSAK